jgi:hypothetical protein
MLLRLPSHRFLTRTRTPTPTPTPTLTLTLTPTLTLTLTLTLSLSVHLFGPTEQAAASPTKKIGLVCLCFVVFVLSCVVLCCLALSLSILFIPIPSSSIHPPVNTTPSNHHYGATSDFKEGVFVL